MTAVGDGSPQTISRPATTKEGLLQRMALSVSSWMERWFPDAFVFALIAVVITAVGAAAVGAPPQAIVSSFGNGFWDLIIFTMQVSIVAVAGFTVATSPPAARAIDRLARYPRNGRQAVAFVAAVATLLSLLNWAISLIFSALLVRELARKRTDMDYRAAGAAAFLGVGSVWALGLSSAPAQMQANASSMTPAMLEISGVLPYSETIFLPQSLLMAAILVTVTILVAYFSAPSAENAVLASDLNVDLSDPAEEPDVRTRPGDWLECSQVLPLTIALGGVAYVVFKVQEQGWLKVISDLNTYNFFFIMLGLALHGTPRKFLRAAMNAIPSIGGVVIQFPFYAGVAAILTQAAAADGTTLSSTIADLFSQVGSGSVFAPAVAIYSIVLGIFLPSGGGKWIIESPYVMSAAQDAQVHLGWTVQVYNAAEALPNLVNPFWMLPVLGVLGLRARHVVGFTFIQFLVHLPIVLVLAWLFARTLNYEPPVIP